MPTARTWPLPESKAPRPAIAIAANATQLRTNTTIDFHAGWPFARHPMNPERTRLGVARTRMRQFTLPFNTYDRMTTATTTSAKQSSLHERLMFQHRGIAVHRSSNYRAGPALPPILTRSARTTAGHCWGSREVRRPSPPPARGEPSRAHQRLVELCTLRRSVCSCEGVRKNKKLLQHQLFDTLGIGPGGPGTGS